MEPGGAYSAERAAALSGVPKSTVHYWARHGFLVPSVSIEKPKLWSYADLLRLRVIYWLRQPKDQLGRTIPRKSPIPDRQPIPPTTMRAIQRAFSKLAELDLDLFDGVRPAIRVDHLGEVYLPWGGRPVRERDGQLVIEPGVIDLIAPFEVARGQRGPDLVAPRPHLRIIPSKLSGSPHVEGTRVETEALHALEGDGFSVDQITELYPALPRVGIDEALALERQLAENLLPRAA